MFNGLFFGALATIAVLRLRVDLAATGEEGKYIGVRVLLGDVSAVGLYRPDLVPALIFVKLVQNDSLASKVVHSVASHDEGEDEVLLWAILHSALDAFHSRIDGFPSRI